MKDNILLSKIVAIPGVNSWCQVYTTLNLYVVVSITTDTPDETLTSQGKDLLEKIQREYFSLDEKNLENIKKSIETAVSGFENKNSISLVLATIKENILYIVIASNGVVMLKRGDKIGAVAEETNGDISAFSGKLMNGDVIVVETADFAKKVTTEKLASAIDHHEVNEISENLAPIVHEDSKGGEAAIILKYVGGVVEDSQIEETETDDEKEEVQEEKIEEIPAKELSTTEDNDHIDLSEHEVKKSHLPKFNLPNIKIFKKRNIIILVIIVLAAILVGSVLMEKSSQESKARQEALSQVLDPQQQKFDEAVALAELNKGLALDEFKKIKEALEAEKSKFAEGSEERKKLDEFIGKVEGKIGEFESGSTITNQQTVFENAGVVTFRDGDLTAIDQKSGKIFILNDDGEAEDEYESENGNVVATTSNDTYVFVVGDEGISRTTKSNGTTTNIIDDADGTVSIDIFGSNLYGLTDDTVNKYTGSNYARSDYFTEDITLTAPTSMAIDASIWVIDGGKLRKFTRGKEDSFAVNGSASEISDNSLIFTGVDYENIYVLDKSAAKLISIAVSSGEVENQYAWTNLSNATSFAVDENGGKAYIGADNKIYSFDL